MRATVLSVVVAVVVAAAGCQELLPEPPVELEVDGVTFGRSDATPPLPTTILDPDRLTLVLQRSAALWGVPVSNLAGLRVGLSSQPVCPDGTRDLACYQAGVIWLWNPEQAPYDAWQTAASACPEHALPHEIGHFLIGDPTHSDPRFIDAEHVLDDLPRCEPGPMCTG
jgi:hypothetical protein